MLRLPVRHLLCADDGNSEPEFLFPVRCRHFFKRHWGKLERHVPRMPAGDVFRLRRHRMHPMRLGLVLEHDRGSVLFPVRFRHVQQPDGANERALLLALSRGLVFVGDRADNNRRMPSLHRHDLQHARSDRLLVQEHDVPPGDVCAAAK